MKELFDIAKNSLINGEISFITKEPAINKEGLFWLSHVNGVPSKHIFKCFAKRKTRNLWVSHNASLVASSYDILSGLELPMTRRRAEQELSSYLSLSSEESGTAVSNLIALGLLSLFRRNRKLVVNIK